MAFTFIRSAATLAACALVGSAWAAVDLPVLNIDKSQTTVSGLSSGGYMAVQLHVAFSSVFAKGAGVVAAIVRVALSGAAGSETTRVKETVPGRAFTLAWGVLQIHLGASETVSRWPVGRRAFRLNRMSAFG